jgi:hypothetical protein
MSQFAHKAGRKPWDGTNKVIPEADYIFEVVELKDDLTKKTNAPMWIGTFVIISDGKGGKTAYAGDTVKGNYVLEGDGAGRTQQLLTALGVVFPEHDEEMNLDPESFKGKRFLGAIQNNPSQDGKKTYNNIINERPLPPPAKQTVKKEQPAASA